MSPTADRWRTAELPHKSASKRWSPIMMPRTDHGHRPKSSSALVAIAAFATGLGGPLGFGYAQVGAQGAIPRAVTVAKAVAVPAWPVVVAASAASSGKGTVQQPHKTIGAAVTAAEPGAVICVAEGTYAEKLTPGEKHFTL